MKQIIKKIVVITGAICLLCLSIVDLGCIIYFNQHFMWGTKINDLNVSGYTIDEAKTLLESEGKGYELKITERMGKSEVIKGDEIGFCYKVEEDIKDLKKQQNSLSWPFMKLLKRNFKVTFLSEFDEKTLGQCVDQLACCDESKMIAPEDAYVAFKNGQYEVMAGKEGTTIDKACLEKAIREAVQEEKETIDVEESGSYKKAEIDIASKELIDVAHTLEQYVNQEITYDFGDRQEKVTSNEIKNWLCIACDDENKQALPQNITVQNLQKGEVVLDEAAVENYVEGLAEKYNTVREKRQFKTTQGKMIEVPAGDYGWRIDVEEESKALVDLLKSKTAKGLRKPIYKQEGYCRAVNDIGNSYVEVDLTKQHLWFYKEGKLVVEGDVVSGMGTNKHATPAGVFSIDYKQRKAILRGPGYACPVSYWMPFYDGMGIHDATWRRRFGGTIYMHDGSHGCLNVSLDLAAAIYAEMESGIPVVCYH